MKNKFLLILLFALVFVSCESIEKKKESSSNDTVIIDSSFWHWHNENKNNYFLDKKSEISGSETGSVSVEPVSEPNTVPMLPAGEAPLFAVIPETLRPGEPLTIAYSEYFFGRGSSQIEAVLLDSRERRQAAARFFDFAADAKGRKVKAAIMAIPTTMEAGRFTIRIQTPDNKMHDIPLTAEQRSFPAERIHLDQGNTDIRTAPNPRREADASQLWAILARTGSEIYADGPFLPPVTSTRRTSTFGSRRIYQYVNGSEDTSIHAGVDYGVPKGTEVRASARGLVVLAKDRLVTGNSVVMEHYPGVYSLYYHLETIIAEDGAIAEAGELIGLSGSTGLSTGPHLHWEIRAATVNADPDAFLVQPLLDKNVIFARMKSLDSTH